jgi:adenine phosphoribosyltransferase
MTLQKHLREIPDFPRPGINFIDISPLLARPQDFQSALTLLHQKVEKWAPDFCLGVESRGFLIAPSLALSLNCGVGMIRKKGRLPGKTLSHRYTLEYGEDEIELQPDMIPANSRVLLVDDLIATGGTLEAAMALLGQTSAQVVGAACLVELGDLGARQKLGCPFESLWVY